MTRTNDKKAAFVAALAAALDAKTFIKLTLGKFRGEGEPSKAVATLVALKGVPHLKLVTSLARKDDTKTFSINDGINHIKAKIGERYLSATLFSTDRDVTLTYSKKREPQLTSGKPTLKTAEPAAHDRVKSYLVAPDRPYLKALQVSDAEGRIKPTMQGKYRQICRFIEIFDGLLKEADQRKPDEPLSILDIGSGKGYLTFALYDHLTTTLGRTCRMTGIEVRGDLVKLCNELARSLNFSGLAFEAAEAQQRFATRADIVIALHACDTATDDAMALGIAADAQMILAAPCCQHELAPQIKDTSEGFSGVIKYPLLKQRQADLVTDAARALLLEASGYKVKVIEFVSTEHTAKNILIAATKSTNVNSDRAKRQYQELKRVMGFETHHLASQLKDVE
jgi:SAM-dependent methyltransferase